MTASASTSGPPTASSPRATGTSMDTVSLDSPPDGLGGARVRQGPADRARRTATGQLEFGWAAKRNPQPLAAVKRLFATEDDVTDRSHARSRSRRPPAIFFRQIQERAAAAGLDLDRAVVTIPANSRGAARFRTKICGRPGGHRGRSPCSTSRPRQRWPTARRIGDGERVLVFDWGGGTLDVTVLQNIEGAFMEEASKGIQRLGGIDLDEAFRGGGPAKVPDGLARSTRSTSSGQGEALDAGRDPLLAARRRHGRGHPR